MPARKTWRAAESRCGWFPNWAARHAASHDALPASVWDDRFVRQRVLIVDDHPEFRLAAAELLEDEGFVVVGSAADGPTAIEETRRARPDVVLLDIQLPGMDGFAVADLLATLPEPPAVVLTSSRDAASYGARIAAAPSCGFIAKRELSGAALAALVP